MTDWLSTLKARLRAATPYPPRWRYDIGNGEVEHVPSRQSICLRPEYSELDDKNLELIAHSPTDLDKAIRIIELQEKALLQARRALVVALDDTGDLYYANVGEDLKAAYDEAAKIKGEK